MDLQKLKLKLINDKPFAPVYDYFLENIIDPSFVSLGVAHRHPVLEELIRKVAAQISPHERIDFVTLIRISEEKFVHGTFAVGGRLCAVFFFEQNNIGLTAIPTGPPLNEMKYARFSMRLPQPFEPSLN